METSNNLLDKDWHSLFGKEFQAPEFQEIITQQPGKKFEHKIFKDNSGTHEYYFNHDLGVSLSFNNGIFSSIFIYGKFDKKFTACTGKLPYFLNFDMNNADIVSFLGEPNKKQGGRTVPISLTYERLGIEFTFISPIWDISDNKLNFICLFPKNTSKSDDLVICALCRKSASSFCSQCKTVAYCSLSCQTAHWKVHKIHCNQYFKNKPVTTSSS